MDSRERVERALAHEIPDRVPVDYWGADEVTARLMKHYGYDVKEQLLSHLNVDFVYIEGPVYTGPPLASNPDGTVPDHFGVPRKKIAHGAGDHGGAYSEVASSPLEAAATVKEIEQYPHWPRIDWFDYEPVRNQALRARESGKMVVFMGDRLNRCAQLKPAMYLRGMEQILMDLYMNESIAQALFERITEFYSGYLGRTLEAADGNIDILFTGDDFGTQHNTFMSVDMWRAMLRPGFKRFIDIGHAYGCKVAHHTCGSIASLIPDFIECGLDILNPLQPEALGMDFARLKRDYGRNLAFHGGISIQRTLPYGSRDDIQREVRDRVDKLADGGGYILCTAHNIQADTPIENIEALFEAYRACAPYG